jgi:fructosamine-3-kinase
VYETDNGLVFVKKNSSADGLVMFLGELESLKAIEATKTVRVPKPYCIVPEVKAPGGAIVMEYIEMSALRQHSGRLGELLARMHSCNAIAGKEKLKKESWVGQSEGLECIERYGFHVSTCCGIIAQNNEWEDNWIEFFARNKLKQQIDLIEKNEGNRELIEMWSELQNKIDKYFTDIKDDIVPALLHGDLWSGNACQTAEEPVIYDSAAFYGHSEFDLSIGHMFGGFNRAFYECYHNTLPKSSGYDRSRLSISYFASNFCQLLCNSNDISILLITGVIICINCFIT